MKHPVIENIKQFTIKEWLLKLKNKNLINTNLFNEIIRSDNSKFTNLEFGKRNYNFYIPNYVYLSGKACNETYILHKLLKLSTTLYDVRIVSKYGTELPNFRIHGLSKDALIKFILGTESLAEYFITISEHFEPEYSGTISSSPDSLLIELVQGQHLHLTQAGTKKIYYGKWSKYKMIYNTEDITKKKLLWQALQKIILNKSEEITPLNPPQFATGYFEFLYSKKFKLILTDYNTNIFFINNQGKKIFY